MRVYHGFFWYPDPDQTFPDTDPDPAKWYGSDRIRIRNTVRNILKVSSTLMDEVSKDAESKMFRVHSIILEVWTIWRPPEAV